MASKTTQDASVFSGNQLEAAYSEATQTFPNWSHLELDTKVSGMLMALPKTAEVTTRQSSVTAFLQQKEPRPGNDKDIRVRDTEFAIPDTPRIVVGDELENLRQHAEILFRWYDNERERSKYTAPCMPIVQSSGTGKTKLLYDFRNDTCAREEYDIFLISCLPRDTRRNNSTKPVYDECLNFQGTENSPRFLENSLKSILDQAKGKDKCVIMFDEAQELSHGDANHMLALRKFLRKKRRQKVIAFYAGTNQRLANCYPTQEQRASSREGEVTGDYYDSGKLLYGPMYGLYTMGCFAAKITFPDDASEFDRAIPYGRPLFARLLFPEISEDEVKFPVQASAPISENEMVIIAVRMLLNHSDPFQQSQSLLPFLSIWATRVQLGGVQTAAIGTLVAKGYAHLTNFQTNNTGDHRDAPRPTVSFVNMPDPVCARLAMCMMQEGWTLKSSESATTVEGKSKKKWTAKLKELFSSGLCRPSRGVLGQLLSATYLLFCGDLLRYKKDNSFRTFSVPVSSWVSSLENPNGSEHPSSNEDLRINFIQFCRNDLRFGLEDICNQSFLEYLYESCCAVYAHEEGCSLYDASGAIKWSNCSYIPLIVSIKTRDGYTEDAARKNIDAITKALVGIKQNQALVLVVLLDRESDEDSGGDEEKETEMAQSPFGQPAAAGAAPDSGDVRDDSGSSSKKMKSAKEPKQKTWQKIATESRTLPIELCCKSIVSRVITIPSRDPFNLTDVVRGATRSWEEASLFSSHAFAGVMPAKQLSGCRKKDKGRPGAVLLAATKLEKKLVKLWADRRKTLNGDNEADAMDLTCSMQTKVLMANTDPTYSEMNF